MGKMMRRVISGILVAAVMVFGAISPFVSPGEGAARRFGTEPGTRLAERFNTDQATFMQDVKNGKTLEEIAVMHGVNPQKVKAVFAERLAYAIQRANYMGKISDEQAQALQDTLEQRIDQAFSKPGLLNLQEKRETVLRAGAAVLGMTLTDMTQALGDGKTIKELAENKNVPVGNVTAAMEKQMFKQVEELVEDGILPAFMVEQMKKGMHFRLGNIVQSRNFGQFCRNIHT